MFQLAKDGRNRWKSCFRAIKFETEIGNECSLLLDRERTSQCAVIFDKTNIKSLFKLLSSYNIKDYFRKRKGSMIICMLGNAKKENKKTNDTFSKVHSEPRQTSKMDFFRKQLMAESC